MTQWFSIKRVSPMGLEMNLLLFKNTGYSVITIIFSPLEQAGSRKDAFNM